MSRRLSKQPRFTIVPKWEGTYIDSLMQSTSFTTSPNTRFIANMDGRPPPLVRARKRVRNFVKGTFGRLKPGANEDATYQDLLWTSLTALKTSADAFPPLKGVVGAVISIMEISQV